MCNTIEWSDFLNHDLSCVVKSQVSFDKFLGMITIDNVCNVPKLDIHTINHFNVKESVIVSICSHQSYPSKELSLERTSEAVKGVD